MVYGTLSRYFMYVQYRLINLIGSEAQESGGRIAIYLKGLLHRNRQMAPRRNPQSSILNTSMKDKDTKDISIRGMAVGAVPT